MANVSTSKIEHLSYQARESSVVTKVNGDSVDAESYKTQNWINYRNGELQPYWKELIAAGHQAGTHLDGARSYVTARPYQIGEEFFAKEGYQLSETSTKYVDVQGILIPFEIPDYTDVIALSEFKADNLAKQHFVSKIRHLQTTFQGGTFVGELGKLIAAIKNPVKNLRFTFNTYLNRLKRDGIRYKRLPVRARREIIGNTWLEFQYGWLPTVHDITDAARALADHVHRQDVPWKTVRGVGFAEERVSTHTQGTNYFPGFSATYEKTSAVTVIYHGLHEIGTYALGPRRLGFDPSNWLPTAWELVPYSFLVDYFTNVGDIISAATMAKNGLRWMMRTVVREIKMETIDWAPTEPQDGLTNYSKVVYAVPGHTETFTRHVSRDPYTGSLVPFPDISLPNSSTKWLNMAALIKASKDVGALYLR